MAQNAWYREMNRYHWFVLAVAAVGWMFDTMAQQLFNLARSPAIAELMGGHAADALVNEYAGYATSIFMIGWAIGGVLFGVLGDRMGRVKTMIADHPDLLRSSPASACSPPASGNSRLTDSSPAWASAASSPSASHSSPKSCPPRAPYALGLLQAFSAVGNMIAAGVRDRARADGTFRRHRRAPGGICSSSARSRACSRSSIFKKLKEPEAVAEGARRRRRKMGSFGEFLRPRWRRNCHRRHAPRLLRRSRPVGDRLLHLRPAPPRAHPNLRRRGIHRRGVAGKVTTWIGIVSLLQNFGSFFGVYAFTWFTGKHRPAHCVRRLLRRWPW